MILLGSAVGLVRLHATGGYCTLRHALVPAMILILGAGHGLTWLLNRISIPGTWFGLAQHRLRPGPVVWAAVLALLIVPPWSSVLGHSGHTPFDVYYETGEWLSANTRTADEVLDLTDWSLFFSQRPGYRFADVYEALDDAHMRWVVLRKPQLEGHWLYSKAVRQRVADRHPVMVIPADPRPGEIQLRIYDLQSPPERISAAGQTLEKSTRR